MRAQSLLEGVGVLFLNRRQHRAALVALCSAASASPRGSSAWYGVGNALLMLSTENDAIRRLRLSLSCLLRALEEDPDNRLAKELIEVIERRSPLTPEDRASCGAFAEDPGEIPPRVGASVEDLVRAFVALPAWQERMQVTMFVGEHGGPSLGPVLAAALKDAHGDVCMAALKRLRRFATEPALQSVLTELVRSGRARALEPYSSMALRPLAREAPWAARLLSDLSDDGASP